jgi:hypothetical protein
MTPTMTHTTQRTLSRTAVTVLIALILAGRAPAQSADGQLGFVHFETSCNEVAQRRFDRAMRYQHSFWYRESKEIFEEALKADPGCAIAYWGIAQSLLANPFNPPPPRNLKDGAAVLDKAMAIGAKTSRENDLIAAIAIYYAGHDKIDAPSRLKAYAGAMEELARRYPGDDEVQIYYALALDVSAAPSDKTYSNQLKAAAILEPIFRRAPRHPGVAHYLIHTYDYPPIAQKGLDAAARYARIAEAAPHAQHMPSHIFTRVGYWKESIASNATAARLAKDGNEPDDRLHASDYMVYALLQLGRDTEAQQIIEEMSTVSGFNVERNTAPFALAASPARAVMERGDWRSAARLAVRPSKFPYTDAMTHFARAIGAARSGDPDAAKVDTAKLAEIRDRLRERKDAYWAEQVDIQWQAASAWVAYTEGRKDDALKLMSAAADAEDKTEKGTVTPGPLVPARELQGEMLLDLGVAKEALAAFATSQAKEPNRFRAFLGAARAAEALGDKAVATTNYEKLLALVDGANSQRPELDTARSYLTGR